MSEQLLDQLNKNHDQQIDTQELQKAFANKFFENTQNREQLSYELNQGINTLLEESFCRVLTTAYLDAKKRIGKEQEKSVIMLGSPSDRAILNLFHELSKYNNQLMHLQQELEQKKVATDTQYKELQEGKIGSDKRMQGQLRQFEANNFFDRGTFTQKQQLLITESKKIDTMQGLTAQQKESLKINLLLALTRDKKTGGLTVFGIQDRVSKQRPAYDTAIQQLQAQKTVFEANCSPEDIDAIAKNTYNDSESKYRPVLNDKQRMLKGQLEAMALEEKKLQDVASYFAKIQALPCSALAMPMQQFAAGREWQIPFISGIQDLGRTLDILNISKKQSAGQSLSPSEQLLLGSFAALEQGRNAVSAMKMTGYDIGSGTSSTVNFLVEIGLSGGLIGLGRKAITAGVKKGTTQVIKGIVRKETRKEAIGVVTKGAKEAAKIGLKMTGTIQAHNTARSVVDELVPEYGLQLDAHGEVDIAEYSPGSSIIKGVIKGVAKAFINNTAEQIGGPIVNELFGYLPKSVLSSRVLKVLETGQMKKILQDGFVGESIEEFISQGLTGLHDAAWGDTKLSDIYSLYGAKVTVLTCMLVSGGVQGLKINGNKINFTDHGQAKIIDLGTKENTIELTPQQEQKTESAIKEIWKKALIENKLLVINLKQQIDIIRQDFDSEIRKQNTPEGIRSRQNFVEFWKNMSKIGITGLVTWLPPLMFIPGSQVALLYMSQNQKTIKKFLGLTFHALGEIKTDQAETQKRVNNGNNTSSMDTKQEVATKDTDTNNSFEYAPSPVEIEEVQSYVKEIDADMLALDKAIQKEDITAIQNLLEESEQKVIKIKQSAIKGKVNMLRAVARQRTMIRYGEHIVHTLSHASNNMRALFLTKGTLSEKLSTTLTLSGEVITLLYHGGHLLHFISHPDPQGLLTMSHLSSEALVVDSFTYRLESFAKGLLARAKQRNVYKDLLYQTKDIGQRLTTANEDGRVSIIDGIHDNLHLLQSEDSHAIVNTILTDVITNPNVENIKTLENIIILLNPNSFANFESLWTQSKILASEKIVKALEKYKPELDGIY